MVVSRDPDQVGLASRLPGSRRPARQVATTEGRLREALDAVDRGDDAQAHDLIEAVVDGHDWTALPTELEMAVQGLASRDTCGPELRALAWQVLARSRDMAGDSPGSVEALHEAF